MKVKQLLCSVVCVMVIAVPVWAEAQCFGCIESQVPAYTPPSYNSYDYEPQPPFWQRQSFYDNMGQGRETPPPDRAPSFSSVYTPPAMYDDQPYELPQNSPYWSSGDPQRELVEIERERNRMMSDYYRSQQKPAACGMVPSHQYARPGC